MILDGSKFIITWRRVEMMTYRQKLSKAFKEAHLILKGEQENATMAEIASLAHFLVKTEVDQTDVRKELLSARALHQLYLHD